MPRLGVLVAPGADGVIVTAVDLMGSRPGGSRPETSFCRPPAKVELPSIFAMRSMRQEGRQAHGAHAGEVRRRD
jgi:hypothetical protein